MALQSLASGNVGIQHFDSGHGCQETTRRDKQQDLIEAIPRACMHSSAYCMVLASSSRCSPLIRSQPNALPLLHNGAQG